MTRVPEGVKGYNERGWPAFERAISSMLTPSWQLLDLGRLTDEHANMVAEYGEINYTNQLEPSTGKVL